jgi:hypothetical protein
MCPSISFDIYPGNEISVKKDCEYPKVSYGTCSYYVGCNCPQYGVDLNFNYIAYAFGGILFIIFVISHLLINDKTGNTNWKLGANLLIYTAIPALDTISNFLVLTDSTWANQELFSFAWIFYFAPIVTFIYQLWRDSIRMKTYYDFWFFPLPKEVLFEQYDTVSKITITFFGSLPFVLTNFCIFAARHFLLVPHILWFCFGFFLFSTKVMCIGRIQRFWNRVWTGESDLIHDHIIDQRQLNEQYLSILILQSAPWLLLQIVNTAILGSTSDIQIVSLIASGTMIFAGLYRYVYFYYCKKIPLGKVPVTMLTFFDISVVYNVEEDNQSSKITDADSDVKNPVNCDQKDEETAIHSVTSQSTNDRIFQLEDKAFKAEKRLSEVELRLSLLEPLLVPVSNN